MFAYDKTFDPKVVLGQYDLISRFSDFPLYLGTQLVYQGSHRLEKYLKMKGCLEKYLKTKFALKNAGKLAIGLEKHLNFTSFGIPDNKLWFQNQM